MNGMEYVVLAYAVGLGLLWGYGLVVWIGHRNARRTEGEGQ